MAPSAATAVHATVPAHSLSLRRYSTKIALNGEGIWVAEASGPVSYPDEGHAVCLQVEDRSFWFRHRNRCIVAAARRFLSPDAGPIFDVGGGNGYVSMALREAGFEVVLVEPGPVGARNAKRRGLPWVVCGTTTACEFAQRSLPAVGLFDVVEHIEDDQAFLHSIAELLVASGPLMLTVPAHRYLWSHEDDAAGHFRRYTHLSIADVLQRAGFTVRYSSYFFRPLPLPILFRRALPYRLGLQSSHRAERASGEGHVSSASAAARALDRLLLPEVECIAKGEPMGFGASLLVVAQAPA